MESGGQIIKAIFNSGKRLGKTESSFYALLRKLEWSGKRKEDFGHGDYSTVPCCPMCGAIGWSEYPPYEHMHKGHKADCSLDTVIREMEADNG
jgi:hypothetical protein